MPAKKKKGSIICPICEDTITDGVQDSIECEGLCHSWLHRTCAALSKSAFQSATQSSGPFLCVHCRLEAQQREIAALRESLGDHAGELASLKSVVDELSTKLEVLKQKPRDNTSLAQPPQGAITTYSQALSGPSRLSSAMTDAKPKLDRKSNLVVFGVAEHPTGTPRHTRTLEDLSGISGILSKLSNSISEQSIKDCFRLGKFKEGRSRPILVKMLRICDQCTWNTLHQCTCHTLHQCTCHTLHQCTCHTLHQCTCHTLHQCTWNMYTLHQCNILP